MVAKRNTAMEDDMARKAKTRKAKKRAIRHFTTPELASGYLDDSVRPFKVFLEANDFVRVYGARRLNVGEWELEFSHPSKPVDIKGLRMFVTSVGIGGSTVDNANVFVREIKKGGIKPPALAIFRISTVRNYIPYAGGGPIDPSEPANTSFHFLLVYFNPSNLIEFPGHG
jgi:hypothetical protein